MLLVSNYRARETHRHQRAERRRAELPHPPARPQHPAHGQHDPRPARDGAPPLSARAEQEVRRGTQGAARAGVPRVA
ncbi:hypothetical protein OUY22_34125, partial [Nonomuraea sp. MCN248]|nr:hypothetical protein [Nonomuraea corallina]